MPSSAQNGCESMLAEAREQGACGRVSDAQKIYRTILELQPDNYQALTRFAQLEFRNNNFDSAISLLEKASGLYADDQEVWFCLGVSYRAAGQPEKSIPCFESAIRLTPEYLQAYLNLGVVYEERGDLERALAAYRHAGDLDLLEADSQCQYARLLEKVAKNSNGSFDEAIAAYESGIAMDPASPAAYGRLGFLLESISRVDEAESTVRQGLAHSPTDPLMNLVLAKCRYHHKKYIEGIACLSSVNINDCPAQLQVLIYAELAALHDKSGDYDRAFEYLSTGNHQSSKLWSAHSGETTSYLDKTAQLLRQVEKMDFCTTPADINDQYDDPVFLIGFPRSGTTLLDQVLDSHGSIHTAEEIPVISRMLERTENLGARYPAGLEKLKDSEIEELRSLYFEEMSSQITHPPGSLFVDKLPLNISNVLLINRIFPGARYILAVRHPCDVCLSCFMQSFSYTTAMASFYRLDTAVQLYDQVMRLWMLFEANLDLKFHRIRYEDVVIDLEGEARQLLEFLGVQWDENILYFDHHARKRASIRTPSYRQVTKPIYKTSLYRWTHYRRYFEHLLHILQPHIEHFGYRGEGTD